MSDRLGGVNEETKPILHETPHFTFAFYSYEATRMIDCIQSY